MPKSAVELVEYLIPAAEPGSTFDARIFIEDPAFASRAQETITADAEIQFTAPGGGALGGMGGPFTGPTGFRSGWAEWLTSWDEFTMTVEEFSDVGEDRALLLVHCFGRMAGSELTLEQGAAALYTAAAGRLVRIEHFLDQMQARRAAGLD